MKISLDDTNWCGEEANETYERNREGWKMMVEDKASCMYAKYTRTHSGGHDCHQPYN